MKTETDTAILSTTKKEISPQGSPRNRQTHNTSCVSNNMSAIHEDDSFIRDKPIVRASPPVAEPKSKPRLSREEKPKRYSIEKNLIPVVTPSPLKMKLATYMNSKSMEVFLLGAIAVYTILVLVNIVLDDGSDDSIAITDTLRVLQFIELGVLVIFMVEILLRIIAFSVKGYFKDAWYIVDAMIIVIIFALIIVGLDLEEQDSNGLNKVRRLFRLFRVFLMLRKVIQANDVSRITKTKVRTTGIDFKTPVEKVLEILDTFKEFTKDKEFRKEIQWAIEIVSTNRLYDEILDENGAKVGQGDVSNWLKNYSTQQQPKDEHIHRPKRRSSIMPTTLVKTVSRPGAVSTTFPPEAIEVLKNTVDELHFDVIAFKKTSKEEELSCMMHFLFERHNLFQNLNIDVETFMRFIKKVQSGYLPNPYHSSTHAADVVQTTNYLLTTGELLSKCEFNNIEIASLLISAAIHDYDHPGTNNAFHVASGSKYAIKYNDKAVLENHHVSSVFSILQNENYNIFSKFNKDDYKNMRERIISIVLATDMTNHFNDVAKLKGRLAAGTDFDMKQKDKKFMMEIAVHTADISNPSKPWDTCREWTVRVVTEFWDQGDKERDLGLPITYLCDRYTVNMAKSQLGFIDFVVAPLFGLIKEIMPRVDISNLETNKSNWKELVDKYEEELKVLNEKKNNAEKEKTQL